MREYTGGYARTSVQQNLVLRWVRDESVYDVWQRLGELGLGDAGADEITDVVSCPGTDSCKLGITSSMGLNQAVQERLEEMRIEDPLTKRIHIKMSGCPNGCSQHHIANIGFYGASIKVGDKTVPAYVAHIGGTYEGGEVAYGTRLKVRLPAKRVPDAVERWIRLYEAEREEGEVFNDFAERVGAPRFEEEVKDLALPSGVQPRDDADVHRLEGEGPVRGHPGRGRVRGLTAQPDLEALSAEEVLADAIERFHPRLALACSFQKEESVLLHMLMRLRPDARVFTIDTGVLFDETRETWRAVEERYGVRVEVFDALDPDGEPWTAEHCCSVQKVAALERALGGLDAWITGPAPRAGAHARGRRQARMGRAPRPVEVQSAGRLERPGRVALHLGARPALQPAARPRLRVDRMRAVHEPGLRPRGPLGGAGQDRVRPARRGVTPPPWTR